MARSWLLDLPAQEAYDDGTLIQPTVRSWDFIGFDVQYNTSTQRLEIRGGGSSVDWKESVRMATTGALPANTRTDNVITASANGSAPAIDGVTPVDGDRVLLQNEAVGANNGLFVWTSVGDASNPFVLTRATLADNDGEISPGLTVFVEEGTSYGQNYRILTNTGTVTINSTALVFGPIPGASGEANTASNVGGGTALFKQKIGVDLEFKTLSVSGQPLQIAGGGDAIVIQTLSPLGIEAGGVLGSKTTDDSAWLAVGAVAIDLSTFPSTGRVINWKTTLALTSGAGTADVRLYNTTTSSVVTGSTVTTASATHVFGSVALTPDSTLTESAVNNCLVQIRRSTNTGPTDLTDLLRAVVHIIYS